MFSNGVEKQKEVIKIQCKDHNLVEMFKTVSALVNTYGGDLILLDPDLNCLAKFFIGLNEQLYPSVKIHKLSDKSYHDVGKAIVFSFSDIGILHKFRGFGTFVRENSRNKKLSLKEKNALKRRLTKRVAGQGSLFELFRDNRETHVISYNTSFSSPISINELKLHISALLEQRDESRDVFISYCHQDYQLAQQIKIAINNLGLSTWIDERVLEPGDTLPIEIGRGIGKSKLGVILISANSNKSFWVQAEISLRKTMGRFTVPLYYLKTLYL